LSGSLGLRLRDVRWMRRFDYCVETSFGFAEFDEPGWEVEEGFEPGEGDDEVVEVHDGVDLIVDAANVVRDLGVEEGAGDYFQREGHAGGGDIDGLAGFPCFPLGGGAGDDLVAVGIDALAVEGRCDDAALTHVDGVVGGDEACRGGPSYGGRCAP